MVRIYALHGTREHGFKGIGDGDRSKGGYVQSGSRRLGKGSLGPLGHGVYCTTSYNKSHFYGDYVYLLEFDVDFVLMVNQWDKSGSWQRLKHVDGAYAPAGTDPATSYPDDQDEFCMRGRCLKNVYLVQYPGTKNVPNSHYLKKNDLGDTLRGIAKETKKFPDLLKMCNYFYF